MENNEEMKPKVKKGLWKPEEDLILKIYVETHGEGKWGTVSQKSGLMRGAKSCRLRWKNYLRPNIKRGRMSEEEEDMIIRLHKLLGNRWSLIAGRLPGRTDNEVKNYWNTHFNKKCPSGKRKTTNSNNNINNHQNENDRKRHRPLSDSQPISPQGTTNDDMDGRKQERKESNTVSDAWIQDAQSMNYYIESPMVPDNKAAFVLMMRRLSYPTGIPMSCSNRSAVVVRGQIHWWTLISHAIFSDNRTLNKWLRYTTSTGSEWLVP